MPPVFPPDPVREQLLDETLEMLQPLSSEPLTREDARQCLDDLLGLFTWLLDHRAAHPVLPSRSRVQGAPPTPPRAEAPPAADPAPAPGPRRRARRQE